MNSFMFNSTETNQTFDKPLELQKQQQNNNSEQRVSEQVEIDLKCAEKVSDSDVESNADDKVNTFRLSDFWIFNSKKFKYVYARFTIINTFSHSLQPYSETRVFMAPVMLQGNQSQLIH